MQKLLETAGRDEGVSAVGYASKLQNMYRQHQLLIPEGADLV